MMLSSKRQDWEQADLAEMVWRNKRFGRIFSADLVADNAGSYGQKSLSDDMRQTYLQGMPRRLSAGRPARSQQRIAAHTAIRTLQVVPPKARIEKKHQNGLEKERPVAGPQGRCSCVAITKNKTEPLAQNLVVVSGVSQKTEPMIMATTS